MTTAMHSNVNGRKHRAIRLRAPEAASSVVDSEPSLTASTEYSKASTHIPAIAGVISAIGVVIILVLVAWKYTSIKKKARSAPSLAGKVTVERERHYDIKHIDLEDVSVYMEKPEKAVLTPTSFDNHAGWVPQVKTNQYGAATKVALPQPMAANKKSRTIQLTIDSNAEKPRDISISPPPSYFASNGNPESQSLSVIPIPPSPPTAASNPPTPPTPPANRKMKSHFSHLSEQAPLPPTPSPRSESFAAQDIVLPRETADTYNDDSGLQKLPRLMTVGTTFTPSLDDELAIKLGDTVRMVEEYRDGWCLVQRVGRIDAPKGVVPRFCLQERRGVVPAAHKLSSGSLKGQSWR